MKATQGGKLNVTNLSTEIKTILSLFPKNKKETPTHFKQKLTQKPNAKVMKLNTGIHNRDRRGIFFAQAYHIPCLL